MKHILILCPNPDGHHADYARHQINYVLNEGLKVKLTFVVDPSIIPRVCVGRLEGLEESNSNVAFIALTKKEITECMHKTLWLQSFYLWRTMIKYLRITGAESGSFSNIDLLQLPLALRLPVPKGKTVSGILFRPSLHYKDKFGSALSFRQKIKNFINGVFYRFMISNNHVKVIYSLDPYFVDYARKTYPDGFKVVHLPDPATYQYDIKSPPSSSALIEKISKERTLFFLFGVLDKRKGIFKVLDALYELEDSTARKVALLFCGQIVPGQKTLFMEKIEKIKHSQSSAWVYVEDRYLPIGEMFWLFDKSDIILAPYQKFTGSSGVVMLAAGGGKPVITQEFGLIGALTKEYKLGLAVDTENPEKIAEAITTLVNSDNMNELIDSSKMAEFASIHTSDAFAEKYFKAHDCL